MIVNRDQEQALGRAVLGRPYQMGAKWPLTAAEPEGPVDCSGFARWYLFRCRGVVIPDGSYRQVGVCQKLPADQQREWIAQHGARAPEMWLAKERALLEGPDATPA